MPMGAEMSEDIRVFVVDESPGLAQGLHPCAAPTRAVQCPGSGARRRRGARGDARTGSADLVLVDLDRDGRPGRSRWWARSGTARGGARVLAASTQDGPDIVGHARWRPAPAACCPRVRGPLPDRRFRRAVAGELVLPRPPIFLAGRPPDRHPTDQRGRLDVAHRTVRTQILRALADGRSTPRSRASSGSARSRCRAT